MNSIDAAAILAVVLPLLGKWFKTLPWVKDELIPILLMLSGGLICLAAHWFLGQPVVRGQFIVGAMAGLSSVGINQAWRQLRPSAPQPTTDNGPQTNSQPQTNP